MAHTALCETQQLHQTEARTLEIAEGTHKMDVSGEESHSRDRKRDDQMGDEEEVFGHVRE